VPKRIQRSLLRTQVQDLLLEQILDGVLAPGAPLTIQELADSLDVSRTPLREALVVLEREGLVEYSQRSGWHVWPLSAREAVNLYQIAGSLERLAVRTTEHFAPAVLEALASANTELGAVQGNPEQMIQRDGHFHSALTAQTNNTDLLNLIDTIRNRLHRYRLFGYEYVVKKGTGEKRQSVREHGEIVELLRDGDMRAAADHLELHWERGTEAILGWLHDPDEGPPEYGAPSATKGA